MSDEIGLSIIHLCLYCRILKSSLILRFVLFIYMERSVHYHVFKVSSQFIEIGRHIVNQSFWIFVFSTSARSWNWYLVQLFFNEPIFFRILRIQVVSKGTHLSLIFTIYFVLFPFYVLPIAFPYFIGCESSIHKSFALY